MEKVRRALQYAYRDRRVKKRDMRALWITRIGSAARMHGLNYAKLMHGLKLAHIALNRKMLADMAVTDPSGFEAVAGQARQALNQAA